MSQFGEDLLLTSATAREIFREIENMPALDIHTHVDLEMVLDNEVPSDPWTALCKGDHYVFSIIESLGAMPREALWNDATAPYDKWLAYASITPRLLGNQIRDWLKLTLTSLGIDRPFNAENARAIWDQLSQTLNSDAWRPVNLFKNTNIRLMSTTDNPVDPLDQIERAAEPFGDGYWVPAWRPDPFFNLGPAFIVAKPWIAWVRQLEEVAGKALLGDLAALKDALAQRHAFFHERGCRASDYGVGIPYGHDVSDARARAIYEKASKEETISPDEVADFQSYMVRFSMGLDFDKGWSSQIHFGARRNQRELAREIGGLDSGCDTIGGDPDLVGHLHDLLNHFDSAGARQHKILLYTLDKADWPRIAGLSRIFPSVYAGVSWWYFDSVSGMTEFMRTMPDMGAGLTKTGPFVTDARNIYTLAPRTQVYRRCLASVLGEFVEQRADPLDEALALARHMCGDHVKSFIAR